MRKLNDSGSLLIPLVIISTLLLGALGFGFWAFAGMQDYKNNSDQKSAVAVAAADKVLSAKKDLEFAEKEKSPLSSYTAPSSFGSLNLQYPKTWSAYVVEKETSPGVNGYMFPGYVPDIANRTVLFALRFQVVDNSYDKVLKTFEGLVKSGKVTVAAYQAPKVTTVVGSKLTGQVVIGSGAKTGTLVLLPLRDKTIQIWTEGDKFQTDFNDIVLANMTFIP
jgi:hypothetical protein